MGYYKENFKRIRDEYKDKRFRAESIAEARREELYREIPALRELDARMGRVGLAVLSGAMQGENVAERIAQLRRENEALAAKRGELLRANGFPTDYTEPQYECPRCRDTGYVDIKMCACMRRRLVEEGMRSSGLGDLLQRQSFDNFSLEYYAQNQNEHERMQANFRAVRRYAEQFEMGPGKPIPESLLFLGGTGLGKTHLSTAVARVVIERGYDVLYNTAVGMLSDFEFKRFGNGMTGDGDDTARYTECDLLILDDLGTEVINQFTLSCIYHVINTRLNSGKPTLINTNLSSNELRKLYSDRITSRLIGEYRLVPFYGVDIRRQKLQRKS